MTERFCFVISPIGERGSRDRRRADGVLDEIIRPALEPIGYLVERADHDKSPGIVTEAFIAKIVEADLVVADLTGLNPNVMYELAVRHATGKAVIQILEEGQELPFDVRSQNTLYFACDLAGRGAAIRMIQAAEEAVHRASDLGNPIKRTLELRALSASAKGQDSVVAKALLDIQAEISRIRTAVSTREPAYTVPMPDQSADAVEQAKLALRVRPFNPETRVLHFIASRACAKEGELLAGLTANTDPERLELEKDDLRMALYRLVRKGIVEEASDASLRLLPKLAEAGYAPPPDPYRAV
jgi:hypothetical protein